MSCFNNLNSDSPLSSPSRRPTNQNTEPMSRTLSLTERGRPTEKRSATLGTKRLGKVKIDFRPRKKKLFGPEKEKYIYSVPCRVEIGQQKLIQVETDLM